MKTGCTFAVLLLSLRLGSAGPAPPYTTARELIPRGEWKAQPVIESDAPGEAMVPMGKVSYVTVHQTESVTPANDPAAEHEALRSLQRLLQEGKLNPKTGRRTNRMGDIAYHY